jgi:aryl-alcohol dehydrogenase-like predicted oxidoreductase
VDTAIDHVRLGRTNLEVSVVGLGCGGHSRLGMATGHDEHHAAGIVRRALDRGITLIDTAQAYGTEAAVGMGIRGRRDQVVISTKSTLRRGEELLSPSELTDNLHHSLRLLGTDHVDLFHFHGLRLQHYEYCVDVLLPELRRQQQSGTVRHVGVTEVFHHDPTHEMLQKALVDDHFDVVMVGFNLLNSSARRTVFPLTLERDVATLVMFAVRRALCRPDVLAELVGGLVARGEVDAGAVDVDDPLGFLRDYAEVSSVVEAAYRYCRHEPGAHVVLTGTGDPAHLDANIRAMTAPPLPDALRAQLDRLFGRVESVSGN